MRLSERELLDLTKRQSRRELVEVSKLANATEKVNKVVMQGLKPEN